jgi:membrane-associated HD superfamily phosphohydrolase
MASHMPVNHSLRPLYRVLALAAGVFVLIFGVIGFLVTQGDPILEPGAERALGLRTNPAFSYVSIATGALVVLSTVVGRNFDRFINLWVGSAFLIVGTAMLALMGSDMNVLNFTMVTVIVSYVIGSVLFTAGLYVKTARTA